MEKKLELLEAARRRRRSKHLCPPSPKLFPWFVIRHRESGKQIFYNQSSEFANNKSYCWKSIPEFSKNLSYWQSTSHRGWLVILCLEDVDDGGGNNDHMYLNSKWKRGDCILWNPFSFETIKLPSLRYWFNISAAFSIINCVLSSPPTKLDNDSMVFFLLSGLDCTSDHFLVFCHPGDKRWTKMQLLGNGESYAPESLCFIKGKLHIPCSNNMHMVLEKELGPDGVETLSTRSFGVTDPILSPIADVFDGHEYSISTYVESCEELFKVITLYNPTMVVSNEFIDLQVFRMDFTLMDWVEVKSLGDHVLFIGNRTRLSCSAAELGLTRGCVYDALPNDMTLYSYDLEDGSISFSLPYPKKPKASFLLSWLQIPKTVKRVADGGRRTMNISSNNDQEEVIDTETRNNKTNDDENEGMNDREFDGTPWGMFNQDILELIATYLHPVDYIHYRAVCRATRLATPAVSWNSPFTEITQTTFLSPWLIFLGKKGDMYNFVDPMHNNEKYFMNLSGFLLDATIRFAKGGWLLMSRGKKTLFFYNPFTKAIIHLPDLLDEHLTQFYGISFSSLPTSPDSVVFSINIDEEVVHINFISRGVHSWRHYTFPNTRLLPSQEKCLKFIPWRNNPVFYNGGFYCLDHEGTLGVFDFDVGFHWTVMEKPRSPCNAISQCFLVECEGKLLSVFLGPHRKRVRIFELNFSKMVWVKVISLGKHMLFTSNTSSFSAIAPCPQMENKIYFPRFHGEGIVYYSLDTSRYHSVGNEHSSQDYYDTKEQLYSSWIEPNWSHTTAQELDWLSV